jgi:hypothetical protein
MPILKTFLKRLVFLHVIQGSKSVKNMDEGAPGEDRNTLRDNSMTLSIRFKKGGHGTSLFYSVAGVYRGRGRRGDL